MFNKDFYPTPRNIVERMIEGLDLLGASVLEPSAGKGDILKVIIDKYASEFGGFGGILHAIEKEPELQSILRDMDYVSLIDTDFMEFYPQRDYDYIIMNPPFSNGLDHFIRAYEIGNGAGIVCLMNSATVHGNSTKAQMVRTIIADNNGTITELGSCFQDSERRTAVDVCMIKIKSESAEGFNFEFEAQFDRESEFDFSSAHGAELAIRGNVFEDYEKRYNLACEKYAEMIKKGNEFLHYASSIATFKTDQEITVVSGGMAVFNNFRNEFRKACWMDLFAKTHIAQYLPSTVKKKFEVLMDKQGCMNFTAKNMRNLFMDLFNNREGIMQSCIEHSFDLMTKYHEENRIHTEGWKSNDRWEVSRKIVLPFMRTYYPLSGENYVDFDYRGHEKLRDIYIGLCWMTGKKITEIDFPGYTNKSQALGEWHDSEFFEFKMFKKGTLHLKFKDENLWKKFNIQACSAKNWLKGA